MFDYFFLAAGNCLMPGSGSLRLLFGFCYIPTSGKTKDPGNKVVQN